MEKDLALELSRRPSVAAEKLDLGDHRNGEGLEERPQRQHVPVCTHGSPEQAGNCQILVPAAELQALPLILLKSISTAGRPYVSTSVETHSLLTASPASAFQSPMAPLYLCPAHPGGFVPVVLPSWCEWSAHYTEAKGLFPTRNSTYWVLRTKSATNAK